MNLQKIGALLLGVTFIGSVLTLLLAIIWGREAIASWAFTSMICTAAVAALWGFIQMVVEHK